MWDKLIVGIDLATKSSGVCLLVKDLENKKPVYYQMFTVITPSFNMSNIDAVIERYSIIPEAVSAFVNKYQLLNLPIHFYVELSNFGNNAITNAFHFLAGVLYVVLNKKLTTNYFKFFNSEQWFKSLCYHQKQQGVISYLRDKNKKILNWQNWNSATRASRKATALAFCKMFGLKPYNEDEADAFAIAYFGDVCTNTIELYNQNKTLKKIFKQQKITKEKNIINIQKEIIKIKEALLEYRNRDKLTIKQEQKKNLLENKLKEWIVKLKQYKNHS